MLCVIAFFSGDKHLAINLAEWLGTLGGVSTHDCLLVVDKSTDSGGVLQPLQRAFRSVTETSSEPAGEQGAWGKGTTNATAANEMWLTAGDYVFHMVKKPWFWLEVDCVPMRSSWLDEIESEYSRCRKPFMGAFVNIPPHEPHMSGVAVYPPDVAAHSLDMKIPNKIAWDYAGRRDTVGKKKAHFTSLVQHEYRIDGESPTFPTQDSLKVIKPSTAVFHRCKDDTLIARLREIRAEKQGAASIAEKMIAEAPNPLAAENLELKVRLEELERKITELVSRERIPGAAEKLNFTTGPLVETKHVLINKKKPKRQMSEATKAKLRAAWEKRKTETKV